MSEKFNLNDNQHLNKKLREEWSFDDDSPISVRIMEIMRNLNTEELSKEVENNIRESIFKEDLNELGIDS